MSHHAVAPIVTERLIGEVAKRHDLLLSRDEPVLVIVTLNELILAEAPTQLRASLDAASETIAGSAARHIEASKLIAEQLITAAARRQYTADRRKSAVATLQDVDKASATANVDPFSLVIEEYIVGVAARIDALGHRTGHEVEISGAGARHIVRYVSRKGS